MLCLSSCRPNLAALRWDLSSLLLFAGLFSPFSRLCHSSWLWSSDLASVYTRDSQLWCYWHNSVWRGWSVPYRTFGRVPRLHWPGIRATHTQVWQPKCLSYCSAPPPPWGTRWPLTETQDLMSHLSDGTCYRFSWVLVWALSFSFDFHCYSGLYLLACNKFKHSPSQHAPLRGPHSSDRPLGDR